MVDVDIIATMYQSTGVLRFCSSHTHVVNKKTGLRSRCRYSIRIPHAAMRCGDDDDIVSNGGEWLC
jgi:hypothetical protein